MRFEETVLSHTTYEEYVDNNYEIPIGWNKLVKDLLRYLLDSNWNGKVFQIKEKFGRLRIYLDLEDQNPEFVHYLMEAETLSSNICQECGSFFSKTLNFNGLFVTVCNSKNCRSKYEN